MATTDALPQHERLERIKARLQEDGSVRIDRLAKELLVSEMTVRRDLDELEALGLARRIRGGAVPLGPETFAERHRLQAREKARMAEKLLPLVPQRGAVAFDASSTIHRLATALEGSKDLVVVTNGIDAFKACADRPGVQATLTGGNLEPRTGSLVGPVATRGAEDFLFEAFFCSAAALDPVLGSSEASIAEAEVKRALARQSSRIILAVDNSKLDNRAQARMFGLNEIDVLVTDLDRSDSRLDNYRASVKII